MNPFEIIDAHIPSLTDEDAAYMADDVLSREYPPGWGYEDLAVRTCACGVKIDGFYEYVDHLKAEFRKAEIDECSLCHEYQGQMAPPHFASDRCESGKHPHCSCDVCF